MCVRTSAVVVSIGVLAAMPALATAQTAPAATTPAVTTYAAQYEARYKGRRVGSSEFAVTRDAGAGTYEFSSTSRFRGLLRLVSPKPVVRRIT